MTALPKIDVLNEREQSLLYSLLDHFYDIENFCKDCSALIYEADTGAYFCPCGNDPDSNKCYRSQDWLTIADEAENFIQNIRGCWER